MPFDATGRMAAAIPFAFDDYLELVDSTGRVIREDIPGETPKTLERLNIDPEQFIATAGRMLQQFSTAIGTPEHLTAHCVARNVAFLRGMGAARALFEPKAAPLHGKDPTRADGHPHFSGFLAAHVSQALRFVPAGITGGSRELG